ncbi:MAG: hypothetical protein Q7L55_08785 [Actinomycetota bacterium]|nr:hypothetical protein [Actinomycetota bacterium]
MSPKQVDLVGMHGPWFEPITGYAAISGNVIFALWVLFNGVDSGFSGSRPKLPPTWRYLVCWA